MNLSAIAIKRPVFTVMMAVALMVLGVVGYQRLGTDLFPDVAFPVVGVNVIYPGASPAEVETQVSKPIEDAVISLNGIDRVRTYSREGVSTTVIMFKLNVDVQEAATQVRERVAQARFKLPKDVEEPVVNRFDSNAAPVLLYTLRGQRSLSQIRKFADDVIRPALEQVDGVAAVNIRGGAEREVKVMLDRARIDALNVPPSQIVAAIQGANLTMPAGRYEDGQNEISVRALGELAEVGTLRDLVVAVAKDGSAVRLRDVAEVEDGFADLRTRIRVNTEEAVSFELIKQSGRNTVEICAAVRDKLDVYRGEHARGADRHLVRRGDGDPDHPYFHARSALDVDQRGRAADERRGDVFPDVRARLHAEHDDAARALARDRAAHR
jgi:hydrophobic/amphiphilic exporter-1 (mainly G- bacteria), HAE1 family